MTQIQEEIPEGLKDGIPENLLPQFKDLYNSMKLYEAKEGKYKRSTLNPRVKKLSLGKKSYMLYSKKKMPDDIDYSDHIPDNCKEFINQRIIVFPSKRENWNETCEEFKRYKKILNSNGGFHDGWEGCMKGNKMNLYYWWAFTHKCFITTLISLLEEEGFKVDTRIPRYKKNDGTMSFMEGSDEYRNVNTYKSEPCSCCKSDKLTKSVYHV